MSTVLFYGLLCCAYYIMALLKPPTIPVQWLVVVIKHSGSAEIEVSQRAHDAIITSLWRQNDAPTSFWRHNDVILSSCVRWGTMLLPDH